MFEGTKTFFKVRKPGVFVNFFQFLCSWVPIRIRILNTDPDPGQLNYLQIHADLDQDPQH